ncbi:hypothetical protein Bbelb_262950 [Branchiostoma belcheri]|nr:hypothetical protein Bbelb_262950 [Branchiostoma belcheri]
MQMKPNPRYPGLHNMFIDILSDHGLEQMVDRPTRGENTLYLIVTNNPQLIPRVEVLPGLSDHDAVFCEVIVHPQKRKQAPRLLPLYKKADWDGIRNSMADLAERMQLLKDTATTEELWSTFKDTVQAAVKEFIPHKQARTKENKPWITPVLHRLIKRRDRVFKKMRKQGTQDLKVQYKKLRREVQRQLRRAYWSYLDSVFEESNLEQLDRNKKFWTYIKHQKSSNVGIAALKDGGRLVSDPKVFKKGEQYDAGNYRPVSLTSVCCKVLEHILTSTMMDHLEHHGVLCNHGQQHGFRRGRSCESQLLEFTEELFENMVSGRQTDVLVMDFAKAFDKVNHSLLQHKLHHYGIRGEIRAWITAFLTDRTQAVVVNVLTSSSRLFADDTAAYNTITSTQDQVVLQRDLERLAEWEQKWDMMFHPGKCQTLRVTRSRSVFQHDYQLHGHTLEAVPSLKYLGVTITKDLTWKEHINNLCNKANTSLGFLKRNLKISTRGIKKMAYKTYIMPEPRAFGARLAPTALMALRVHSSNGIGTPQAPQRCWRNLTGPVSKHGLPCCTKFSTARFVQMGSGAKSTLPHDVRDGGMTNRLHNSGAGLSIEQRLSCHGQLKTGTLYLKQQ